MIFYNPHSSSYIYKKFALKSKFDGLQSNVLILYGSQTRTSEIAAKLFFTKLRQLSSKFDVTISNISDLEYFRIDSFSRNFKFLNVINKVNNHAKSKAFSNAYIVNYLTRFEYIVIFISTWIDGSFPKAAKGFYNEFENLKKNIIFKNQKLSIIGFGDSQYRNFCNPAKYLAQKFQKHGAELLHKVLLVDESDPNTSISKIFIYLIKVFLFQMFSQDIYESEEESVSVDLRCNSDESEFEDLALTKNMLNNKQREQLVKEGYKIVGSHSAVKLCRWTKAQLRGRGGCYKHSFYGIESYLCMEGTPSLACANKCVFCWRHHKNPVATSWKWSINSPKEILDGFIANHINMIKALKGVPNVNPERFQRAISAPKHCALSLVGEPIMYPELNRLLDLMHEKKISTFLVTNAQFPDQMKQLKTVTQLYVSVDAATRETLKAIDQPLNEDYWERFQECLSLLHDYPTRTVFRLTLVNSYNMQQAKEFGSLILKSLPDFVEIKAVTYSGTTKNTAQKITMKDIPWHDEVIGYAKTILKSHSDLTKLYAIAAEHQHSCCVLIASKKFYIDNEWYTWIDYDKFFELVSAKVKFNSLDYCAKTPSWAIYKSKERGFDPVEQRVYIKGKAKRLLNK